VNGVRVVRFLERMTSQVAAQHGVPDEERVRYVRWEDGKSNYSLPSGRATWLYLHSVGIDARCPDTGDIIQEYVGVPQLVVLRDPEEVETERKVENQAKIEAQDRKDMYLLAKLVRKKKPINALDEQLSKLKDLYPEMGWTQNRVRKARKNLQDAGYWRITGAAKSLKYQWTSEGEEWFLKFND
jgi:hypothetical protein